MSVYQVSAIIIGRNEGERFKACVQSLAVGDYQRLKKIYVDSGSTDGSLEFAQDNGWHTVSLDMSKPFTAARARNAGAEYCREQWPETQGLMFIDGDCSVAPDWLATGVAFLNARPDVVGVAGQRQERFPEASIYNQLCDMEWRTPEGSVDYVGGDSLVRAKPFWDVGGFDAAIIAGEEPELFLRLRAKGYAVWCLDVLMTEHDANIHRGRQWFKRVQRAGYAFARVRAKHQTDFWRKEERSIVVWGGVIPTFVVAAMVLCSVNTIGLFAALLAVQWWRIGRSLSGYKRPYLYAWFCLIGKPVEFSGVLKCWRAVRARQAETLIEYK